MTRLLTVMVALIVVPVGAAQGATYEVGPGKPYATLEDVDDLLGPGDVVLVSGGADYPGGVRLERDGSASAACVPARSPRAAARSASAASARAATAFA